MAQWIRSLTLIHEVPGSTLLAVALLPLAFRQGTLSLQSLGRDLKSLSPGCQFILSLLS